MKVYFISFLSLFCCWGCTSHEISDKLCTIDLCMPAYPDSICSLLQRITAIESFSDEELANYASLISKALNENNSLNDLDSLIDIAVEYYGGRNEIKNRARTFFLKGLICEKQDNIDQALYYYKQVDRLIPEFLNETVIIQQKYFSLEIISSILLILLCIIVLIYQRKILLGKREVELYIKDNEKVILEIQRQFAFKLQSNSINYMQEITQLNDLLTLQLNKVEDLKLSSKQISMTHAKRFAYYESALSGMHYYINIIQNKDISQLDTKSLRCLIDCYEQIDKALLSWIKEKNAKLTPREIVICILIRMGKNKNEIIKLLRCSDGSYRTMKNRIKKGLGFDTNNDVEICIKKLQ